MFPYPRSVHWLNRNMFSLNELQRIMPHAKQRAEVFYALLVSACREFEIDNPLRIAAFLAQIAHESGELRYVREIASGEAYEGRKDLGNVHPGDGKVFRGRGLLQITGRTNYKRCGDALGIDLSGNPSLLEEPDLACRSAAWFWKERGLNELADKGDFKLITKRINGGYNGWLERLGYYERAKEVFE